MMVHEIAREVVPGLSLHTMLTEDRAAIVVDLARPRESPGFEGGPWCVFYGRSDSSRYPLTLYREIMSERARAAERVLWNYLRKNAPVTFAECQAKGWVS